MNYFLVLTLHSQFYEVCCAALSLVNYPLESRAIMEWSRDKAKGH